MAFVVSIRFVWVGCLYVGSLVFCCLVQQPSGSQTISYLGSDHVLVAVDNPLFHPTDFL